MDLIHIRIAGSEISVIRNVKNAIFISAVSPLRNVLAVFANNNYYLVFNPTLPLSPEPLKSLYYD